MIRDISKTVVVGLASVGLLLLTLDFADGGRRGGGGGGGGGRGGGGGGGGRGGGVSRPSGGARPSASRPSGGASRPSVNRSPGVSAPKASRPAQRPSVAGGGPKLGGGAAGPRDRPGVVSGPKLSPGTRPSIGAKGGPGGIGKPGGPGGIGGIGNRPGIDNRPGGIGGVGKPGGPGGIGAVGGIGKPGGPGGIGGKPGGPGGIGGVGGIGKPGGPGGIGGVGKPGGPGGIGGVGGIGNRPGIDNRPGGIGGVGGIGKPGGIGGVGGVGGIGNRPGASTGFLPGLGLGLGAGAIASRPGDVLGRRQDNIADRRENIGDRSQNLQDRMSDRQDFRNDRPENRQDAVNDRMDQRQDYMDNRREDWQNWHDDYYGHHDDWYHGGWSDHWGGGYWDHMWSEHTAAMVLGTTAWGLNRMGYWFGYGNYSNPYYSEPLVIDNTVINYSEPLVAAPPVETVYVVPPGEASPPAVNPGGAKAGKEPPPAPGAISEEGMDHFAAARASFYDGKYEDALQATNKALAKMPKDAVIHEFRALVLFALGRYREAAGTLHPLLAVGPGWDWTTMSSLYPDNETYTKQLRALETYVRDHPKSADAHFLAAYHYLTCGHEDNAAKELQQVQKLLPSDTVSAQLLQMMGKSSTPPEPLEESDIKIDAAKLIGSWNATRGKASFALTLDKDKGFTWTYREGKNKQEVKGAYAIDGNVLALEPDAGGVMLAEVTEPMGGSFVLRMVGTPKKDPGLTFKGK